MKQQGHHEPAGQAKITPAYNLPSKFVLHTVGPIIPSDCQPNEAEAELLASCYQSCLDLAAQHHLKSIAFCCISTGEFHYPRKEAAEIALNAVSKWLASSGSEMTSRPYGTGCLHSEKIPPLIISTVCSLGSPIVGKASHDGLKLKG